jgi:hypothetical protein
MDSAGGLEGWSTHGGGRIDLVCGAIMSESIVSITWRDKVADEARPGLIELRPFYAHFVSVFQLSQSQFQIGCTRSSSWSHIGGSPAVEWAAVRSPGESDANQEADGLPGLAWFSCAWMQPDRHTPRSASVVLIIVCDYVYYVPWYITKRWGDSRRHERTLERNERENTKDSRERGPKDRSPVTGCAVCGASTCGDHFPQLWRSLSTCLLGLFLLSHCRRSRSVFVRALAGSRIIHSTLLYTGSIHYPPC